MTLPLFCSFLGDEEEIDLVVAKEVAELANQYSNKRNNEERDRAAKTAGDQKSQVHRVEDTQNGVQHKGDVACPLLGSTDHGGNGIYQTKEQIYGVGKEAEEGAVEDALIFSAAVHTDAVLAPLRPTDGIEQEPEHQGSQKATQGDEGGITYVGTSHRNDEAENSHTELIQAKPHDGVGILFNKSHAFLISAHKERSILSLIL